MEDGQDRSQDGWDARDLRSGVAKVYAEAKGRAGMGMRAVTAWAGVLFLFGILNLVGVGAAAPLGWDMAAAVAAGVLAAVATSRSSTPLIVALGVVLLDLIVTAHRIPETIDHGSVLDQAMTIARILVAPVALLTVLNGYFGCLAMEAFKKGFSPGADWRTRLSPAVVQLVVVGSCFVALVAGIGSWVGSVMWGFEQTDVVWITKSLGTKTINVKVAKPAAILSKKDAGGGLFTTFTVLDPEKAAAPGPVKVSETATPILDTAGLDDFAKDEIEDAFDFAKDADEAECLGEAQGRQDRCRDERCKYWSRVFARACLPKCRKTPHFCDDVPQPPKGVEGDVWAKRLCVGRKFEDCREILWAVQGHCHPKQLAAPTPAPAAP